MTNLLLVFGCALAVSLVATPAIRALAHRWKIGSLPNGRTIHATFMPSVGGIAIYLGLGAALAVALLWGWVPASFDTSRLGGLIAGSSIVLLIGLYDDIKGANCYHKFAGQVLASLIAIAAGFRIEFLTNPFGPPIELGWMAWPFTVFWITGMCNAVNLIDGLDGLAAGFAVIAAGALLAVTMTYQNVLAVFVCVAFIGATLGFLRYNYAPASIFMGDTGSLFLGFLLACLAIEGGFKIPVGTSSIMPILILFVPILDTALAVYRRLIVGTHPFIADKGHIHHRLYDFGIPQRQVVHVFYAITAFLGGLAYVLPTLNQVAVLLLLLLLGVAALALVWRLGYVVMPGILRRRNGRI